MKDFRFFHGDFFTTSLRVFAITVVISTLSLCISKESYTFYNYEFTIFIIVELYALVESCCYVSNETTESKSKATDIKALFGLCCIMAMTLIIWIIGFLTIIDFGKLGF